MNSLKLIEPQANFNKEYQEMLANWNQTGEKLVPFVLSFDSTDFENLIDQLHGFKKGIGDSRHFCSTFNFLAY